MKKIIFYLLVACGFMNYQFVAAQNSSQPKSTINFQSILQGGLLIGKDQPGFQVQSINGIRWRSFSTGVGVGIDNYVFRTIPLFIDLRKNILSGTNSPFIFADAGMQFPWVQDNQKSYFSFDYKSKFYFNAGAGYKVNVLKRNALIFSAAYSLKKVDEINNVYCDPAACPENIPAYINNKYTLKRLSLTIGWLIW